MDVGVRELKKHLSEYLERAARGEIVRITDRGRAKALLVPLPQPSRLEAGVEEGWIRAGSGEAARPMPRAASRRSIADVLAEDRGS